jgi:hypothetical protein
MKRKVVAFEETPNPHALKCVVSVAFAGAPRSYRSAESAQGDELARELFAIPGVTGVLICNDFVTVNKAPGAEWKSIRPSVKGAMGRCSV